MHHDNKSSLLLAELTSPSHLEKAKGGGWASSHYCTSANPLQGVNEVPVCHTQGQSHTTPGYGLQADMPWPQSHGFGKQSCSAKPYHRDGPGSNGNEKKTLMMFLLKGTKGCGVADRGHM